MAEIDINTDKHAEEHEYDGIKELNNPAPYWVILLFLVTIGFSGIYLIKYFGYPNNGMDQNSEYLASVEKAKKEAASKAGNKEVQLTEEEMIKAGTQLYLEKGCIACHGAKGEGNAIGPNLTDKSWINGCSMENVVDVITNGRPEKGMTAFKSSLSEGEIKQLSTYILKSLVGSNPEKAKAAQGEECK